MLYLQCHLVRKEAPCWMYEKETWVVTRLCILHTYSSPPLPSLLACKPAPPSSSCSGPSPPRSRWSLARTSGWSGRSSGKARFLLPVYLGIKTNKHVNDMFELSPLPWSCISGNDNPLQQNIALLSISASDILPWCSDIYMLSFSFFWLYPKLQGSTELYTVCPEDSQKLFLLLLLHPIDLWNKSQLFTNITPNSLKSLVQLSLNSG